MKSIWFICIASCLLSLHISNAQSSSKISPAAINPVNQNALSQQADWQKFQHKYGLHFVLWNESTGLPHRVFGPSVPIEGFGSVNTTNIEAAARAFIFQQNDLLRIPANGIELVRAQKVRSVWYVGFRQNADGIPVLNSEVELRISPRGRVLAFGTDYYEDLQYEKGPLVSPEMVSELALKHIPANRHSEVFLKADPQLFILPEKENSRLVYQAELTSEKWPVYQTIIIDALTGMVLEKTDRLCQMLSGTTGGTIRPDLPTDTPEPRNFSNLSINFGGTTVTTDANGMYNYDLTTTTNYSAELKGPYIDVDNWGAADAVINASVSAGTTTLDIDWNAVNSTLSERNVFYYANETYNFFKVIDPGFTQLDYPLKCIVEDAGSGTCNAFWNGTNIHFNVEAAGCINSAHSPATIFHEYGHALNDHVYQQAGVAQGMLHSALHEAMADVACMMIEDEAQFARGFFGPGTFTRNFNNTNRYPESLVGQQHIDGLILAGSFWDLKEATSIPVAASLSHFAKYGTPDDQDIGIAFAEFFLEVLIADDDDGDLGNGTPHFDAIRTAFCNHGIGTNLYTGINLDHQPLVNTANVTTDYEVNFSLETVFPTSGNLIIELDYSTDYFNSTFSVPVTDMGNNNYQAFIPAQPEATAVKYYFNIEESGCSTGINFPIGDPTNEHFSFLVGNYEILVEDDFEQFTGWTVGDPTDNATAGIWQWSIPQQTLNPYILQPGSDHSLVGIRCFVTGPLAGVNWFDHDVDGGKTTLYSPVYDLTGEQFPAIQYYKWYSNDTGPNPGEDYWRVQITGNGGQNWVNVENTLAANRKWNLVQFVVDDYLENHDEIQLRFIANDAINGSIVEALIDDFEILVIEETTFVDEPGGGIEVSAFPNPFSETVSIQYRLKTSGMVRLDIFSVTGQLIVNLNDGFQPAGKYSFSWNGLNENGNLEASGLYFFRLSTDQGVAVEDLVLMR